MTNPGNRGDHAIRVRRAAPALLLVLSLPFVFRCGGSNDVTQPPPARPTVTPTTTPAAPDLVRISGGQGIRSDLVQVDVGIGGPTTSSDIASISFDVVISDPTIVSPATAEGAASPYTAGDVFPGVPGTDDVAIGSPQVLTGPTEGRSYVTVSVAKLPSTPGQLTGNGVGEAGAKVVSITFASVKKGSTTLKLENGVALDSTGAVIGSISFDGATATVVHP